MCKGMAIGHYCIYQGIVIKHLRHYVRVRGVSTTVFVRIWYLDMMVYMGMGMGIMVYIRVLEVTIVV